MARGRNHAILALLLLGTTLVYVNSLSNPFVPDDRAIIFKNFRSQSWTLGALFERSLFSKDPSESSYFRPLTLMSFALNYSLAGEKPQGYRAINLGLHLLVVSLVFLLFFRLGGSWVAIFGTLLYALHPVHVQAVSYISSRSDPLYTALGLTALLCWHKGNETQGGRSILYKALALASFFVGLFAKETMIAIPALAVLMDLTFGNAGSWTDKTKENLPWYLGFLLVFSIYILIRVSEGFPLTMASSGDPALRKDIIFGSGPLFALKLFGLYLGIVFYPVPLYLFRMVPVPASPWEWQVVLGAILFTSLIVLGIVFWRVRREVTFGIVWFLISLVPVLNLVRLNADMMEHWLYLPLIGLTLAFASAVHAFAERVGESRGAAFGMILLLLLLSARTLSRNAEWSDLVKLFTQNVSAYPTHPVAGVWLAEALAGQGKWNEAIHAYKTVLTFNPTYTALVGLADSLSRVGRDDEAEEILSRATFAFPRDRWLFHILGVQRLKVGRNQAAIEAMQKNIALDPSAGAYHVLGSAYLRMGQKEKAEQAFQKAVAIFPGEKRFHARVHVNLGKLYLREGKNQEALEEWQIALRFDPDSKEAEALLGGEGKDLLVGKPQR